MTSDPAPFTPAAPASRAVLSMTHDPDRDWYQAACTRCPWSRVAPGPAGTALAAFLAEVVGHENEHAPAAGQDVQVFRDIYPQDPSGYVVIPHEVGTVVAVDVVTPEGQRLTLIGPPHVVDYGAGDVEVLLPEGTGPFEVWLHGTPAKS